MVPKRKNAGPWKVTEPENIAPPKGIYKNLTFPIKFTDLYLKIPKLIIILIFNTIL